MTFEKLTLNFLVYLTLSNQSAILLLKHSGLQH